MSNIPPGWATDIAILELTGSSVEDHGDHLIVRSPQNPDFHWGNCLFVTDERAVDRGRRWADRFRSAFPEADWIAIGLIRMPDDHSEWQAEGLALGSDEVLTTRVLPAQTSLPGDYTARPLAGDDDWTQCIARWVAENDRDGHYERTSHQRFVEQQIKTRRRLSERGDAVFLGAFAEDRLIAELGIVRCGTIARYQSVSTDEEHRRRGLASHLLGVAAHWAGAHGCDQWVIVTETTNSAAGRVYRRLGFRSGTVTVQAYRFLPG